MKNIWSKTKLFARAIRLVWQAQPGLAFVVLAVTTLSALSTPVMAWLIKIAIDRLNLALNGESNSSFIYVFTPVLLLMGLWGCIQIVNASSAKLRNLLSDKASWYVQHRIVEKSTQLDFSYFESPQFYDQLELCKGQTWRFSAIVMQFPEVLLHLVTTISFFILLFSINPFFPFILIAVTLPKMIINGYFTRKKAELYLENVPNERMLHYMTQLLSEKTWAKEVRLFGLQAYFLNKHENASRAYLKSLRRVFFHQERSNLLLTLLSLLGIAGIWITTIFQTIQTQSGVGNIALVFQSTRQLQEALNQFVFFGSYFIEHAIYLGNVFDFLDLEPGQITAQKIGEVDNLFVGREELSIEFRNVSFQYPGETRYALREVSFTLPSLEKIALVGENGAGKTTIVKLLARLYDPTEGEILVNGMNLKTIPPAEWHRHLGVIFQDFYHYGLSVKENIGFGELNSLEDSDAIRFAAETVGLSDRIETLPMGYDTMVGKQFLNEDGTTGTDFSGGEWQKIALARVVLRSQTNHNSKKGSFFILDEPTAALDVKAEKEFFDQVGTLMDQGTTLFVTHRLSSVKMAEKILVVKNGVLVESGNHQTLMALDGEYAAMFTLQANRYAEEERVE